MIQLIDNYGVIRDDIIPIYWTQTGLTLNLQPIWEDITDQLEQNKKNWQLKYLVEVESGNGSNDNIEVTPTVVVVQSQTVVKQFKPYNEQTNHLHTFSYAELNLSKTEKTVVQLITDQGVIQDTNVVIVWTDYGVEFDLSDLVNSGWITDSTANWSLTYISYVADTNNQQVVSKKYFDEKIEQLMAIINSKG